MSYADNISPWESGRPPGKTALLPNPNGPNTNELSSNLVASANHLFQMGGSEKQLINIVQAVIASVS